ncbi:MAG: ABC transporter ATP-binding protein [Burkholderiaceae bacterium]
MTRRFGDVLALDRIDLSIAQGEFVSFLGPSGCGKSTMLRCMAGLDRPSDGLLAIDGVRVDGPPANLGLALQRDALLEWADVLDNVLLPADFRGEPRQRYEARGRELLDMVGLTDFVHAYPHALSGGMRQRVAICRALLMTPGLLLMDEPFGALDALTRDQLNVDLRKLWEAERMTVVFVTHSITEAVFLSSRVVMFKPRPGQIVDDVAVDLGEPRRLAVRETPAFGALSRHFRGCFEQMGVIHE